MNFLQRTPFLRLLLSYVVGIILFQYFTIPISVLIAGVSCGVIIIFFYSATPYSKFHFQFRWLFGISAMLIFAILGYFNALKFEQKNQFYNFNHKSIYLVELKSAAIEKENSYKCTVELLQEFDSLETRKTAGRTLLYLQKDSLSSTLLMGDRILISAEFQHPTGVQNPEGFDFATYLKRQGINATAYIDSVSWVKVSSNKAFSITRLSEKARNYLLEIYKRFEITGDEFSVLAALTLGYKDALDTEIRDDYSATGATHILSVSGLHVGIVYAVVFFLLGFLKHTSRQKLARILISTFFIWIYAFITGLSPAVFRSALMFSFVAFATVLNRKSIIYNTVLLSAFLMLLFNPNLLFNIGFQLSYTAVLSIVFFQPKIAKTFILKNKFLKWFWELTAVSVAAQIGTLPFALYYFQQFPNYFLLTNYIAIPLATVIISLALTLFFTSFIPFVSSLVAFLLQKSVWLMNLLINSIVELPYSTTTISINITQFLLIFLALFLITAFFFYKKYGFLFTGLISILALMLIFAFHHYKGLTETKMIVFSSYSSPIINLIDQSKNYVITTDSTAVDKVARPFWNINKLQPPAYIHQTEWKEEDFILFKGKRIMLLKDDFFKNKYTEKPLPIDYLIIANKVKPNMPQILECVHPKLVIIDKSISPWYTEHIISTCQERNIPHYSITEKGAFIKEFE